MTLSKEAQDRANARRRAKRANDPVWREHVNAQHRASVATKPEYHRATERARYWKNPELKQKAHFKWVYGDTISMADKWTRLFGDQNGHCANPACHNTPKNKTLRWNVHHIHGSDPMAWGVCCHRCNWASGKFKDDPVLLRGMADLNENLTPDGYHIPSLVELVEMAQRF